jgi:hypothetical protein
MKVNVLSQLASTCGVLFLLVLLAACDAPATAASPATAPTHVATSTQAATSTPTTPLSTPTTASTGVTFQKFTGPDFSISYPPSWQTSQQSLPGKANQPKIGEYAFVAADIISGLHIRRHGQQLAPGDNVNTLLDVQLSCSPGDTSIPAKVTLNGVTWSQYDLLCLLHNSYYEVRDLSTDTASGGHTEIMYGAYQQVGNGAVFLDFAHASKLYFEPMLESLNFR